MKQADLLDYVTILHDCYVYKEKDRWDGHAYFVRKRGQTPIAVLFPLKDGKNYLPVSVCHICNTLDIPVPEYAKDCQELLDIAKKSIPPAL